MQINNITNLQPVKNHKIAIVRGRFNQQITHNLLLGAMQSYIDSAVNDSNFEQEDTIQRMTKENLLNAAYGRNSIQKFENIDIFEVAGSVEIPLIVQKCAKKQENGRSKYQAIIALGAVIKGETPHFDYVCKMVSEGVTRVSLDQSIPVIFGIITTNTQQQAQARSTVDASKWSENSGYSGMQTALEMANLLASMG